MILKEDYQKPKAHAIIFPELESWVRSQVQLFIQDILQQEVTELLGRDISEGRDGVDASSGYRNGLGKERKIALSPNFSSALWQKPLLMVKVSLLQHLTPKGGAISLLTQCTDTSFDFQAVGRREVVAQFNGGTITSDAGALLLSQIESRRKIIHQFAACFTDHREPLLIEHSVEDLIAQRLYGLALGYEDLLDPGP